MSSILCQQDRQAGVWTGLVEAVRGLSVKEGESANSSGAGDEEMMDSQLMSSVLEAEKASVTLGSRQEKASDARQGEEGSNNEMVLDDVMEVNRGLGD